MELRDSINFQINGKLRKIELYLGDITKLSKSDEVDLLLVSAFPSNYVPVRATLIGALYDDLNISIKELAQDKGEDLRTNFHCWISKELKSNLPYRRILCFEQGRNKKNDVTILENPAALVGAVFRALFTTFKDKEWSMITPLLATGNQGSSKRLMIRVMVKACASWIIAGMPLECMKIVIYRAGSKGIVGKYDQEAIDEFSKLKSEINWKPFHDTIIDIKTDVLFFFDKHDEEIVMLFIKIFQQSASEEKCKIKSKCIDDLDETVNGEEKSSFDFEKKILQSKKVVLFLTPSFLENSQAVEKYNLVLCLSHKIHRDMLSPIYLLNIDHLPEYMTLNQWLDCRLRVNENNLEEKFLQASTSLLDILHEKEKSSEKVISKNKILNENKSNKYTEQIFDIFISYCHKDSHIANSFFTFLKLSLPNSNIFFDKSEIKSGYSWQETLYYGINNSKVVLSLLSENYFDSIMCSEEFSVALSQHQSPKFATHLVPIWISKNKIETVMGNPISKTRKYMFSVLKVLVPMFNDVNLDNMTTVGNISICQELLTLFINPILSCVMPRQLSPVMKIIDLEESALIARKKFFNCTWDIKKSLNISPSIGDSEFIKYTKQITDIIVAFHEDDLFVADILKSFILRIKQDLTIKFSTMGPQSDGYRSLVDFEKANLIIILLNPYYISTKSCLTQLQIAFSLHRRQLESGFRIFPLILETLPEQPSFLHLLPSLFKADDEIFQEIINKYGHETQIRDIMEFNHCNYNVKVLTMKAHIMLYFAASWIANVLFRDDYFCAPVTPLVYSTYDLITTNYGNQALIDPHTITDQTKPLPISIQSINSAKQFMKYHNLLDNCDPDRPSSDNQNENELSDISKNKIPKTIILTKVCSIM